MRPVEESKPWMLAYLNEGFTSKGGWGVGDLGGGGGGGGGMGRNGGVEAFECGWVHVGEGTCGGGDERKGLLCLVELT